MIDFVQIELAGERWAISWDSDATLKKVRCTGSKTGLKYCTYCLHDFTPNKAFDIAMTQLKWLQEEFKDAEQTGME
jgi:hypothetical protein|tara:strand:- start:26 stop:253 length:228 start_codon:yes stop_codon:yes gene_type:complete